MEANPQRSPSDFELVDAWRGGDKRAAGVLFDRHFQSIYRFFRSKADAQDVDDLVQRTFLGCVVGKDKFRKDASLRTYLLTIARNRLHSYWKDKSRRTQLDFGTSSIRDLAPSPPSEMEKRRGDRVLLEALRRIPVDMQVAIELHYWEGLSGPQLAEVLEIPEGTVRSRLRRSLEALRVAVAELAAGEPLASTTEDLAAWAEKLGERYRELV